MEKRSRGGYVVVLVTCGTRREAARIAQTIVEQRVAALEGILSTETLIAFRSFSKKDLGLLWDIGS